MKTIGVALAERAYDVQVGSATIDALDTFVRQSDFAHAGAFVIVADRAAGTAHQRVADALKRLGKPVSDVVLDVAETSKSLAVLDEMYGRFLAAGLDRNGIVVAVGGGVIGDLAGFAAATYLRSVRWIGVPTTLLAAVDSSIGGKTGINHALGKNLIGAIHQPSLVVVDRSVFKTLPRRELISGYGEMLKYGLALDPELWDDLLCVDPGVVTDAQIERCIELKADIVSSDERDERGVRETLNFGHTIGHAIEAATAYTYYRHGEAVVLGMRAAVALSAARRHCSPNLAAAVDAQLAAVPLPPLPVLDVATIVDAVARDKKKARGGATRFVLLRAIGETVSDSGR